MKVFISWSGERSRAVAMALHDWLPQVIQAVQPWVSVTDIEKGTRWSAEVASQLEECRVGLICLTPENLSAPWILFEAGALAKTLNKTFVCPYLLDLQFADVQGPLAQFQLTRSEKDDTRKLLHTINSAVAEVASEQALVETRLNATFDKWWPDLERTLQHIPPAPSSVPPKRSDRELLEEILENVRVLTREPPLDTRTATPKVENDQYRPGTLVRHPKWGLGLIQKREQMIDPRLGKTWKLKIIFRSVGSKILSEKYANLEIVSE